MTMRWPLLTFGLLLLMAPAAAAWTVSGQVTDQFGNPLPGIDLDFQDRSTGIILVTPGDNTDATGHYAVSVPTANYRIFFKAPPGSSYFDDKRDQNVNANRTIDMTLIAGARVSGYVKDANGTPLPNVDLNFYDLATGSNMAYTGDNTDLNGFYNVLVDQGLTFRILYRPTPPDPHLSAEVASVAVGTTSIARPDVLLAPGFLVGGHVQRQVGGTAVLDANIDVKNATTGASLVLGYDVSDALGNYQVVIPAGTWDILVAAPASSGLASNVVPGVVVGGAVTVPTVSLPAGLSLSGTVLQPGGAPAVNANLDVVSPTLGVEIPTSGDHTTATGAYGVLIGAGTYDLLYWPPPGAPLAAGVIRNRIVTGATVIPAVTLQPGFVVSGFMRTQTGVPVPGADLNAEQVSDSFVYPTPEDNAGPTGAYAVRVPAGTYRFVARAPAGSAIQSATITATISANTVLDFTLFDPFATGVPEGTPSLPLTIGTPFPNPTSGPCRVAFNIPVDEPLAGELAIFDLSGRRVRLLESGLLPAGDAVATWDGRDDEGRSVASGIYFVNLSVGASRRASRVMVVR